MYFLRLKKLNFLVFGSALDDSPIAATPFITVDRPSLLRELASKNPLAPDKEGHNDHYMNGWVSFLPISLAN